MRTPDPYRHPAYEALTVG